jgi:hypothetical protein
MVIVQRAVGARVAPMKRSRLLGGLVMLTLLAVGSARSTTVPAPRSPICAQRGAVTVYCGSGSGTVTVQGRTYRASGGSCFFDRDHLNRPSLWYLNIGRSTQYGGPSMAPKYVFIHSEYAPVRRVKAGTYRLSLNGPMWALQIQVPAVGYGEINGGRVTLSDVASPVSIPRSGSFSGVAEFLGGGAVRRLPVRGTWRCPVWPS